MPENGRFRPKWTPAQVAALCAVMLLALTVRLYRIQTEAMWYDEISSYEFLDAPTLTQFLHEERNLDSAMLPLYFTIEYFWAKATGGSVLAMRFLSLGFGLAGMGVLYLLGRRFYGHTAGIAAILCAAGSKILIYQSQEIRVYALTILLVSLSVFALSNALDSKRHTWWWIHFLANLLLMGTHLFGALVVAAEGAYLVLTRLRRVRMVVLWSFAQALVFAFPLLWMISADYANLNQAVAWIPLPSPARLFGAFFYVYAGSKLDGMDLVRHLPSGIPVHILLGLVMLAGGAWITFATLFDAYRRRSTPRRSLSLDTLVLLWAWLFLPPIGLYVLSYYVRPCFVDRYTVYSTFPLYLLFGGAVSTIHRPIGRNLALALFILLQAGNLVDLRRPMRPDWKTAQPILVGLAERGEKIYVPNSNLAPAVAYYASVDESRVIAGSDYLDLAIGEAKSGRPCAMAIVEVPGVTEASTLEAALSSHGIPAQRYHYPGRWDVYLWELTPGPPARQPSANS